MTMKRVRSSRLTRQGTQVKNKGTGVDLIHHSFLPGQLLSPSRTHKRVGGAMGLGGAMEVGVRATWVQTRTGASHSAASLSDQTPK